MIVIIFKIKNLSDKENNLNFWKTFDICHFQMYLNLALIYFLSFYTPSLMVLPETWRRVSSANRCTVQQILKEEDEEDYTLRSCCEKKTYWQEKIRRSSTFEKRQV